MGFIALNTLTYRTGPVAVWYRAIPYSVLVQVTHSHGAGRSLHFYGESVSTE